MADDILGGIIQDFRSELRQIEQKLDQLPVLEEQTRTTIRHLEISARQVNEHEVRIRTLEMRLTGIVTVFSLLIGGFGTLIWYLLTHTVLKS